jgi:hypothetical protein
MFLVQYVETFHYFSRVRNFSRFLCFGTFEDNIFNVKTTLFFNFENVWVLNWKIWSFADVKFRKFEGFNDFQKVWFPKVLNVSY